MRKVNLFLGLVLAFLPTAILAQAPQLGEVEVIGTGPKTLLAIPCASGRWRSFEEFAKRNADRFTTIAVTLPGYGGTSPPPLPLYGDQPVWHEHAVAALENLLKEKELDDVIVVGHSFGSSIAMQLAHRCQDRVAGLVTLDGTLVGPLDRGDQDLAERLAAAQKIREDYMDPLDDFDAWQRFNMPSIKNQERRILYHGWFMASDRNAVRQYWWDNLLVDRNPILQKLKMPILDVQLYSPGARNAAGQKSRYQARIDALQLGSNYSVLFYENVRHFVMEDSPDLLDEIVRTFADGGSKYPPHDRPGK